jgi:hypothetical protein
MPELQEADALDLALYQLGRGVTNVLLMLLLAGALRLATPAPWLRRRAWWLAVVCAVAVEGLNRILSFFLGEGFGPSLWNRPLGIDLAFVVYALTVWIIARWFRRNGMPSTDKEKQNVDSG